MTAPSMVPPSLAHHFEPPAPSRFAPPTTVREAEHRVVVALRASRKAAGELMARAVPPGARDGWSRDLLVRIEGCHDLLDRALADLERLEAQEGQR